MDKKKIYIIISIIFSVIILGIVGTYAWYYWGTTSDNETKIVTSVGAATIYFDAGSEISAALSPTATKEEGIMKTINIMSEAEGMTFNLYLDTTLLEEGLKDESFIYELYKGEELVKEGNFSEEYLSSNLVTCTDNSASHIVLLSDEVITTSVTTYTLYLWIDGVNYTNPNSMQNAKFSFNLHADGEDAMIKEGVIPDINEISSDLEGTLAYKLIKDYYYADKETVTNNGVVYYYDRENNLMSDTDGNIRYYGKTPNNYVYFNCETYPDTNCELWRIIGVFDGNLKIVRNDSIGNYSYDTSASTVCSGKGCNNWSNADLMKLLNGGYSDNKDLNNAGETVLVNNSLYYNSGSGNCYTSGNNTTSTCDFTSKGLKNDETKNMLTIKKWNTNSVYITTVSQYADQVYENEKSASYKWDGEIALANASDYGYAVDLSLCTVMLNAYNDSNCTLSNWMYVNSIQRFLNMRGSGGAHIYYTETGGDVKSWSNVYQIQSALMTKPTLYLNSKVSTLSGNGSLDTPYTLSLS